MGAQGRALRRGWTTGACATAAAKAAYSALLTGQFPDPVPIDLPGGQRPDFALARSRLEATAASAGVVKDAGDDPDVTHGALICARVSAAPAGAGVEFAAGEGVGTVTRPGLPLGPGEPAINPVPRAMMRAELEGVARAHGTRADVRVEISVPGGVELAERTLNARLGILGGLSILGTTGIVIPYSCAAWIHSIHRGIDVARAAGLDHVAGSTGSSSEAAVRALYELPESALIEMGDFVGGMLKYLRVHPVPRISIAGGVAKLSKLAQGRLDLHSKRGAVELEDLARRALELGGNEALGRRIAAANTAAEAFVLARSERLELGEAVARAAWETAAAVLRGADVELEILLFDRSRDLVGRAPMRSVRSGDPPARAPERYESAELRKRRG